MVKSKKNFAPIWGLAYCTNVHPSDLLDVEVPPCWGVSGFTPIFPFQIEF
jgi:hypothetical protein